MNNPKNKWLATPYIVWMVGFTIIPLALIVYYGLTDKSGAFTLANVLSIAEPEHAKALFLSLGLSLLSTLICLVLAYPLAMILRKKGVSSGSFIVFIFILPMWMNFLLRTLAWQTLLEKSGVINGILTALHLPRQIIVAAQAVGGAMGNMICVHNIVAACAVVGLSGREGEVLKRTFWPFMLYGVVVGIICWVLIAMNPNVF